MFIAPLDQNSFLIFEKFMWNLKYFCFMKNQVTILKIGFIVFFAIGILKFVMLTGCECWNEVSFLSKVELISPTGIYIGILVRLFLGPSDRSYRILNIAILMIIVVFGFSFFGVLADDLVS